MIILYAREIKIKIVNVLIAWVMQPIILLQIMPYVLKVQTILFIDTFWQSYYQSWQYNIKAGF